jgi:hypothetical protein
LVASVQVIRRLRDKVVGDSTLRFRTPLQVFRKKRFDSAKNDLCSVLMKTEILLSLPPIVEEEAEESPYLHSSNTLNYEADFKLF